MKGYKVYELIPQDGHKSFYGKAKVFTDSNGHEYLQSYETVVVVRDAMGRLFRCWDNWSATTGRHVRAFCGLDKKGYTALPYVGPVEL